MLSINFDSGNYKEFAINGDENNTVKINVSDMGILTRAQDALKHIDGIVEELTEKEKQGVDNAELFKEQDEKARQMVNTNALTRWAEQTLSPQLQTGSL